MSLKWTETEHYGRDMAYITCGTSIDKIMI